jgi:hypothetical protein
MGNDVMRSQPISASCVQFKLKRDSQSLLTTALTVNLYFLDIPDEEHPVDCEFEFDFASIAEG